MKKRVNCTAPHPEVEGVRCWGNHESNEKHWAYMEGLSKIYWR